MLIFSNSRQFPKAFRSLHPELKANGRPRIGEERTILEYKCLDGKGFYGEIHLAKDEQIENPETFISCGNGYSLIP